MIQWVVCVQNILKCRSEISVNPYLFVCILLFMQHLPTTSLDSVSDWQKQLKFTKKVAEKLFLCLEQHLYLQIFGKSSFSFQICFQLFWRKH